MAEKIEVRYGPTVVGGNNAPWHHKYIVYTDSTGKEFYARGGPILTSDGLVIATEHGEYGIPGTPYLIS